VLVTSVIDQPGFGKKLGANEYLLKPLEPARLRQAVSRLVGSGGPARKRDSTQLNGTADSPGL
jgi:DNA-binding response OmpR family regulator